MYDRILKTMRDLVRARQVVVVAQIGFSRKLVIITVYAND